MGGVLYIVATPIGNLDDLSLRAARTLAQVAAVACEDTRQTAKLMDAAGAKRPLLSLHEHNEKERCEELLARLVAGEDLALVSDAGTPLVSDPGYRLVEAAIGAGIRVAPIPGPSAVMAALAASGLETDAFVFAGFLPHKQKARQDLLRKWGGVEATVIYFESPHRILEALADVEKLFPERRCVLGRELTKLHEEFLRGSAAQLRAELEKRPAIKGEFTLLVERQRGSAKVWGAAEVAERYEELLAEGSPRMDAMKAVAQEAGLSKREVYALLGKAE
ncbi:16S rRNA (cytidine(1402)-2'-O)-methyltransferase [Nostoc sp. NIES-2111]